MPHIGPAKGVAILRETEYLTDAGISTSDGIEVLLDATTLTPTHLYEGSRDDVLHGGGGSLPPGAMVGRAMDITMRGELKGRSGTITDPIAQLPIYHVMLGCGMSGSLAGGTLTVTPVRPDNSASFTLDYYAADARHRVVGCRGSFSIDANAGERGFWEFNGQGVVEDSFPTQTTLPSITYTNQSVQPPPFRNASPSFGSWTPVISSYQFEVSSTLSTRADGGASQAHAGFLITQRNTTWSFPGETVVLGTFDPWSTSLSGTTSALSLTHGSDTGSTFTVTVDDASIKTVEEGDDNGRLLWNLGGQCHIDGGEDEISIAIS